MLNVWEHFIAIEEAKKAQEDLKAYSALDDISKRQKILKELEGLTVSVRDEGDHSQSAKNKFMFFFSQKHKELGGKGPAPVINPKRISLTMIRRYSEGSRQNPGADMILYGSVEYNEQPDALRGNYRNSSLLSVSGDDKVLDTILGFVVGGEIVKHIQGINARSKFVSEKTTVFFQKTKTDEACCTCLVM